MRYDYQMLYVLLAIGMFSRKVSWKGWFAISLFVFAWMMYNWLRV